MSNLNAATPVAYIYVSDRERALAFYCDVMGLKVHSADAFGDFLDFNGALVRMTVIPGHTATPHPTLGWNVADIAATARTLAARGVTMTRFPGMELDDLGIWTAPDGVTKVSFFADPDGNVLSLSQNAK